MRDYVFGANIIENLTSGVYKDSKVIYREYIQNACDQIDKAVAEGLLKSGIGSKKQGFGEIEIWLDIDNRTITIEDNATGIKADDFEKTLGNIADSDKKIGEDKGFRGIGRLCGLAYCSKLIFTSKAKGENVISRMICDADKMRELINENVNGKKHTAVEVLNMINRFETSITTDTEIDDHYFKVELININAENTDLLDFRRVSDYLSFVAPVPYINSFHFRNKIYQYAKEKNYRIDEYNICLYEKSYDSVQPIFKKYSLNFKTGNGDDSIYDIEFKDFFDDDGNLLAWLWFGFSQFKARIDKNCLMRGLRLRKENIQFGDENVFQAFFSEKRGPLYFVGEVFAVSKDLIPNSQRDYFNENETRVIFEKLLRQYFYDELSKLYRNGSNINSIFRKIDKPLQTELVITDEAHKDEEIEKFEKMETEAQKAQLELYKN